MFACCESDLVELYWRYSFYELRKRIELKVGEMTAISLANYTGLVEVANAFAGGDKDAKGKPKITEDLSKATPEHFAARVTDMLSF